MHEDIILHKHETNVKDSYLSLFNLERIARIELASSGWRPEAQPLYHIRIGSGDKT